MSYFKAFKLVEDLEKELNNNYNFKVIKEKLEEAYCELKQLDYDNLWFTDLFDDSFEKIMIFCDSKLEFLNYYFNKLGILEPGFIPRLKELSCDIVNLPILELKELPLKLTNKKSKKRVFYPISTKNLSSLKNLQRRNFTKRNFNNRR